MAGESSDSPCPNCGKMTVLKPGIFYSVFEKLLRQPDGVCASCGTFCWKQPSKPIPSVIPKSVEQKKGEEEPKWHWFKDFIKKEKERRRRRRSRN
jgi:hypothetical protein